MKKVAIVTENGTIKGIYTDTPIDVVIVERVGAAITVDSKKPERFCGNSDKLVRKLYLND